MTTPASPPIKASDINIELGRSGGAAFDINASSERGLAGVASGIIKFSDFLGKSNQSFSFIGSQFLGTGGSVSASAAIGAANANRRVVIVVNWGTNVDLVTLSSATIGGVSATIHVQRGHTGGATGLGVAIISAIVPTGTTATVAATFSTANATRVYASVFRLQSYNTLVDSGSDQAVGTTAPLSVSVTTNAGGIVIAGYTGSTGTASTGITFTNVTEVYDFSDNVRDGGAWATGTSSGTLVVGATQGNIGNAGNDLVATSWST